MRLAISGALGFLGPLLIPLLRDADIDLILISQEKSEISSVFEHGYIVHSYDELDVALAQVDAVLHLAVVNSDGSDSLEEFKKVNVHQFDLVLKTCQRSKIEQLVFVKSLQIERDIESDYVVHNKRASDMLTKQSGNVNITTLILPDVYDEKTYSGNLKKLLFVPKLLRGIAFKILAMFSPLVHKDLVVKTVLDSLRCQKYGRYYVSDRQMNNQIFAFVIRAIDLSFCAGVIFLFWWLLVAVWLLVAFTSSGPGLLAQKRIGKNGEIFTCYKFRTMLQGTKLAGTHEVPASNLTGVGKVIRKFKIDELPQIWNILRNEMSLVGPRPCLPVQQELIEARTGFGVLDVKCGLTGLSQIRDIDMSDPLKLAEADAKYLAIRTLGLDLKIILQTFFGAGFADRIGK